MSNILKLVYSNGYYVLLACGIFVPMLIGLLIMSEFIFITPFIVGQIPNGTEFDFSLIVILSAMSSLVIPMNIYRINILKKSTHRIGGSVFGSLVGATAGACSCGPIGFAIVSTFGSVGATSISFLTNYEIPIRIGAIALLAITYFTTIKSLKMECNIQSQ